MVLAGVGPNIHIAALLADRGSQSAAIATAVAAIGVGAPVGRFITGLDRFSVMVAATLSFVGQALGIALLSAQAAGPAAATFLIGMAQGRK